MSAHPLFCLIFLCTVSHDTLAPDVSKAAARSLDATADSRNNAAPSPAGVAVMPLLPKPPAPRPEWTALAGASVRFLAVMHAFRWLTESDTRSGGLGLGAGYARSTTNLHGWSDGDPFYTNYLGHPAQGSISGRIWSNHDVRYRQLEFGASADYWKGKLRAAAFSWAFSEQFEIGLLSEASIGQIQNRFPQQGFVDHVITPTVGLGLMVAEDAADRYIIKRVENRVQAPWVRLLLRTSLNPTRSFANLIDGRAPWHRDTRAGVFTYRAEPDPRSAATPGESRPAIAPYEFRIASNYRTFAGSPCLGGGAEGAYHVGRRWQALLDVNGCKLLGLRNDLSGDSLFYQAGIRWTPAASARWSPYFQVLLGGIKVTHEHLFPDKKNAIELEYPNSGSDQNLAHQLHDRYTTSQEAHGLAVSAGAGLDYKLNDALALRLGNLAYSRAGLRRLDGFSYSDGFEFSTGMILRLGTW